MNKKENLERVLNHMKERATEVHDMDNKKLIALLGTVKEWETLARQSDDCNDIWYYLQDVRSDVEREILNRMK